ncbi:M4 family metallopeptidase [Kitasatospora sp. NPDC097643]|uniref:M4 family metallopeptidase n=1 Tax=Kitasatospora sp. NPDC097643 TaxID=3157230 RepID=UPI0033188182
MQQRFRLPRVFGVGVTAVLSLALAAPSAQAGPIGAPVSDPAADSAAVPGMVAGQDTATPQLVTGLAEAAPGSPAEAARAYLAGHPDRYGIDPGQLAELGTASSADGRRTVRFEQRFGGVPVLGAQYLVHLTGDGAGQRVESVGGKYFTGLTAPTTPTVPAEALRALAIGDLRDSPARAGATAEDRGLVILPGGTGRLARHFTVRGTDPDGGAGLVREVYVDATVGAVALAYDARAPYAVTNTAAANGDGRTAPRAEAAGLQPATGTAPDLSGRPVKVDIARLPDGSYQFTDLTRAAGITTVDAAGRDVEDFHGGIPADSPPVHSAGPDFPASAGTSGATNAHVNAATVYDFYRNRLGRDGLDGKGGPITSVVNVTSDGKPYPNAYWDGTKMVYGSGNDTYRPFAVALDIAGHEMTHGVIQHTADLVYLGQSGAMDEALADYFGNAIEVTARGLSMNDPAAALLGESLCRTGTPEACATRRLDDHRTTVDDYLGAGTEVDGGGVHLNSTIFGGALWDIRRTLDPLTADRLVYRALADYLTPTDDFVDGRNAVLAAGQSMGLTKAQLRTVAAAFDGHGIRPGWQRRIGVDSRQLLRDAAPPVGPSAAKGRWVMASTGQGGKGGTAVYTGSTSSPAGGPVGSPDGPTRVSPAEDARWTGSAATDGTSAAWVAVGTDAQQVWGMEVLARPLDGGPVRSVYKTGNQSLDTPQVSGGDVAFKVTDFATGRSRIRLSRDGAPVVELPLPDGHSPLGLTLRDGTLGWTEHWKDDQGGDVYAPTVYSIALGKVTAQYLPRAAADGRPPVAGSAVLAGGRLLWVETPADPSRRSTIRSGALDGSGVTDLLSGDAPEAVRNPAVTASDRAVTYASQTDHHTTGWTNAALPKLWQLPLTGGTPERLSCNRGGQYGAAADEGTRVIWLDATTGHTDLVTRNRPAAHC